MKKRMLRIVELFSGVGMQRRGCENAGVWETQPVATCDMDNQAVKTYAAIYNGLTREMVLTYPDYPSRQEMADDLKKINMGYDFDKHKPYDWDKLARGKKILLQEVWLACKLNNNLGDIQCVDVLPDCDLVFWSFPCQSLSVAGKQAGIVEGQTRSGLAYEVLRILKNMKEKGNLPSFLIMENVDNLVSKKFKPQYDALNEEFAELGYDCVYDIMNTKYTGIPQNRRRCYGMYIRKDLNNGTFTFPKKFDNGVRLKDVLLPDDEIDDSYYITSPKALELIEKIKAENAEVSAS